MSSRADSLTANYGLLQSEIANAPSGNGASSTSNAAARTPQYTIKPKDTQDEIFKTLFGLTTNVETIKKRIAKLEKRDESAEL